MPTNPVAGRSQYFTFAGAQLTGGSVASEVRMTINGKEIDTSVIGVAWEAAIQGQSGLGFRVSGVWNNGTATTELDRLMYDNLNGGGTKLYEYAPAGSASNSIKYVGNCIVTSYEVGGAVSDKVGFASALKATDTPTRGTIS